jgi:hypothetical protein
MTGIKNTSHAGYFLLAALFCFLSLAPRSQQPSTNPQEVHYPRKNTWLMSGSLLCGGDNAEAYFSPNGKMLVFQATNKAWNAECDQIFYSALDSFVPRRISTNMGRTTCSYFLRTINPSYMPPPMPAAFSALQNRNPAPIINTYGQYIPRSTFLFLTWKAIFSGH